MIPELVRYVPWTPAPPLWEQIGIVLTWLACIAALSLAIARIPWRRR